MEVSHTSETSETASTSIRAEWRLRRNDHEVYKKKKKGQQLILSAGLCLLTRFWSLAVREAGQAANLSEREVI
jgi:hypothetical protein